MYNIIIEEMAKATKTTTDEESKERTTIFVKPSLINKLDYIVSKEFIDTGNKTTRTAKIIDAIEEYISRYEKKHGEIKR